jgi:hypothetical protein
MGDELAWKWNWWWDPVPPQVLKDLDKATQHQVLAISLEAQAQALRLQADAMAKIGNVLAGVKQTGSGR